jgi:hypothetical protein
MRHRVAICGAVISLIASMSAAHASEVWVRQASGRPSTSATAAEENKPVNTTTPEGSATAASTNTAAGATNPATCSQANASSPACYSATQQNQQNRGK